MKLATKLKKMQEQLSAIEPVAADEIKLSPERAYELIVQEIQPILDTMGADNKAEMLQELYLYETQDDYKSGLNSPLHMALRWFCDNPRKPLYLGPKAYEWYKGGSMAFHDCWDCGCDLPTNKMFPECPLCGGKVGYCYHYYGKKERGELA